MNAQRWQIAKEFLNDALELDPEQVESFLEQACGADVELRRQIEGLLTAYNKAGDFIETPAVEDAMEVVKDEQERLAIGSAIGHYRILREIGHGGMGTVFLAERADEEYHKQVAIKLIRGGLSDDLLLQRFLSERQILANLDHANIARLIDGGATEEGSPYLILEYVEGIPIDDYCDAHKLTTVERLQLFRSVCAAVQYAHQNLIVHRDLKPSNILVTEDGTAKLLDFGIAKLLDPKAAASSEQTATMARIMTPQYASPEQVRGKPITTASDIYSLGVLLYRLLTGHHPYHFKSLLPAEIDKVICETEPDKPSTAINQVEETLETDGKVTSRITIETVSAARSEPPEGLRRRLKGDLDNIVLMAMRKEPERRYSSVEQFAEDIRRHLEGLPILAAKDTFTYRAGKFIKRHKVGVAAAALVLFAILAGLIATAWQARVAAKERDQARQEKARAEQERAKAEQLNSFLQGILAAAAPEEKGKDAKVIEVLNDAAERIDTELANQPELRAQALLTVGQTYIKLGLIAQSEKILREALQLNSELYGEENKATVLSMSLLATPVLNTNRFDEAAKLWNRAVEIERKLSPEGSKELAFALFGLGELYVRTGDYEKAKPLLQEAVSVSERISGEESADTAEILISLGRAKEFSGDVSGAESIYRRSIAIVRQLPQRYEMRKAMSLLNLGRLLKVKGEYDEAISAIHESGSIFQKQGEGTFFPFYMQSYLSQAYFKKGDYQQTVETATKALDFGRQAGLTVTIDFQVALSYLGLSLTRKGRAKEGEPYLRQALVLAKKLFPSNDILQEILENDLGECLTAQNRFAEAEPLVVKNYEKIKMVLEEKNPNTVLAVKRVITFYEKWNKPALVAQYRALLPASPMHTR